MTVSVLPLAELPLVLQIVHQRVDHLGGGAGRLPVVELLVEHQPLHQAVAPAVVGLELGQRPQRKWHAFSMVSLYQSQARSSGAQ